MLPQLTTNQRKGYGMNLYPCCTTVQYHHHHLPVHETQQQSLPVATHKKFKITVQYLEFLKLVAFQKEKCVYGRMLNQLHIACKKYN